MPILLPAWPAMTDDTLALMQPPRWLVVDIRSGHTWDCYTSATAEDLADTLERFGRPVAVEWMAW